MKAIILCHPQSANLLTSVGSAASIRISCGTTKIDGVDFSEANDFFPTYASWNTALFETSVILTVWEHADLLIGDDNVVILHSDILPHFDIEEIWSTVCKWIADDPVRAIGMVAPAHYSGLWSDWYIPDSVQYVPSNDPMFLHAFDSGVFVWDYIKKYDPDMFQWAVLTQPKMAWSHQFACSREVFDALGQYLCGIARRLTLGDIGFWTPHMFERLIALFLARHGGDPILSTAFWHYSSSGIAGPGDHSLYGPRPRKYYKIRSRYAIVEKH